MIWNIIVPGTPFDVPEMEAFYDRYKKSLSESHPVRLASELKAMKYKFRRNAINKANFCQFLYKKAPLLFVVTNAYGIFITDSENYKSRSSIHDIRALQPRHRVSLLVPTIQHLWHVESREMMLAYVEHFINDMKCLAGNDQFQSAIERFGIQDIREAIQSIRIKLIHATKTINGQKTPGIFGLRIENTLHVPSKISVSLAEISGKNIQPAKWKKLIIPSYLHSAVMIYVKGIKITKNGFTVDFNLESLAF